MAINKRIRILLAIISGCITMSFIHREEHLPAESLSAKAANRFMWDQLHQGNYDSIPELIEKLKKAWYENPDDPKINAHLGFTYLWKFCERGRKQPDSSIFQNIYLSNYFFKKAVELNPEDARLYGFQSATEICEGAIAEKPGQILKGYANGLLAIPKWPQFNRFALSFIESQLDTSSMLYKQGMRFQWELIDECSCKELDREKIMSAPKKIFKELITELKSATDTKVKRACWNSWIAPHNFEGFLLNFGDMLVKEGNPEEAKEIYKAAKLIPSYKDWMYKEVINERIRNIEANEQIFNKEMQLLFPKNERQLFINSRISCVACHQMSKEEFKRYGYQEPGEEIYLTDRKSLRAQ